MSDFGTDNKNKLIEKTVKEYAPFIFRIAYSNLKNRYDAEDIMQDVCVAMVTSEVPFHDSAYLKNWLAAVTINKCRDLKKSSWRRRVEPLDNYLDMQAPETARVMEELWQLPEKYRNIIYLYYYEAFKISEIAEILGEKPNTVGSQLRRARKALGKILKEGG